MAHRRTYSARPLDMGSIALNSPPLTPALNFASFSTLQPRKPRHYWQRTTFLALFALVVVSGYIFFVAQPSLSPGAIHTVSDHSAAHAASRGPSELYAEAARKFASLKPAKPKSAAARPQVQLNPAQELAAVSSFLASLPQNIIPSYVDPSKPIDPQLVLDFDTRSPQAAKEIEELVNDVWTRNPVMLYSKLYSPVSRELKQMLTDMNLRPPPTIIEVDQRGDENVLAPLLYRLTHTSELPILLVGGKVVGSMQEIRYMNEKGDLRRMISAAGAEINGGRGKKGRKH